MQSLYYNFSTLYSEVKSNPPLIIYKLVCWLPSEWLIYKNILNATHICQLITKAPRIIAGEFFAAKIGTVVALMPISRPNSNRQTKSYGHVYTNAKSKTGTKQNIAAKNIAPRRLKYRLKKLKSQQPLFYMLARAPTVKKTIIYELPLPRAETS